MKNAHHHRNTTIALACAAWIATGGIAAAAEEGESTQPEFESLSLVLLMRGPNAGEIPENELEGIQSKHLAHLRNMRQEGHMLIAGPFSDQNEPAFRGMCLYRVPVEKARRLAEADPAVKAGRLQVEVMTWWFHAGRLEFPETKPAGG